MSEYWMSFTTTTLTVLSGGVALAQATTPPDGDSITNYIVAILAGAVAVLWKKVDSHYKKIDAENKQFKAELVRLEKRNDDCEEDRKRIKHELEELKLNRYCADCSKGKPQ